MRKGKSETCTWITCLRVTERRENVGMVARERETGAMFGEVVPRRSTEELYLLKRDGVAPGHAVENSFDIDVEWIEEGGRAQPSGQFEEQRDRESHLTRASDDQNDPKRDRRQVASEDRCDAFQLAVDC